MTRMRRVRSKGTPISLFSSRKVSPKPRPSGKFLSMMLLMFDFPGYSCLFILFWLMISALEFSCIFSVFWFNPLEYYKLYKLEIIQLSVLQDNREEKLYFLILLKWRRAYNLQEKSKQSCHWMFAKVSFSFQIRRNFFFKFV